MGDWKPQRLNIIYMPAMVNTDYMPMSSNQSSTANTDMGIYLPALVSVRQSSSATFYWYGRGRLRWLVIGTANGGQVVTINGDPSFYMATYPIGVFVPDDLVEVYKSHERWSKIASYFKPISQFEALTGETLPTLG